MNICFLTSDAPNLQSGGVENVTFRLATAFKADGFSVFCISLDDYVNRPDTLPFEFMAINRDGATSNIVLDFLQRNNINIVINQSVERRWRDILVYIRPQIPNVRLVKVHHTDPSYLISGLRDGEPLYTEGSAFSRIIFRWSPSTLLKRIQRKIYIQQQYKNWIEFYDQVVLLSKNVIDDFKKRANLLECKNVSSINNPVELGEITTIPEEKDKVVLYVGRLHKQAKRPDRLLAVWEMLYKSYPDWRLIFVGDGPMRHSLEAYCIEKNIQNVTFVGMVNPKEYYEKAAILCVTSTYEGFSLACGEAISNEVIPIAFNSYGAISDLITDGVNGLLVRPYSLTAYADKLALLMKDAALRNRIRQNIKRDTEFRNRFSMSSVREAWTSLFHKLVQG